MRNTITLNGIASTTIAGLLIQELPAISKPLMRTTIEEIDGRDGDIVTELGYSAYDKEITIGLYGSFDINAVIAYFATEGTVVFSNEPDKFYRYKIIDQIDYERLVRYRTATVKLHCQPFKYPTSETPVQLGSGQTVTAEGTDITMQGTALAPFVSITPKGDTFQQTYTGKNLFNINGTQQANTRCTGTIDGNSATITSTVDGVGFYSIILPNSDDLFGKTVTISIGSVVSSGVGKISFFECLSNAPRSVGGWSQGINSANVTSGGHQTFTFPSSYTGSYDCFAICLYVQNSTTVVGNSTTYSEIQIEAGSTATDYEPYVGGTEAPNPEYPQDVEMVTGKQTVKVCGKNLFNKDDFGLLSGYFGDNDTVVKTPGYIRNRVLYIPCQPNTTYSITLPPLTEFGLTTRVIANSTYEPAQNVEIRNVVRNRNMSELSGYTTDSTAQYIGIYLQAPNDGTNMDNIMADIASYIQIEQSTTVTEYEAYQGQEYELNLGKNLLDPSQLVTGYVLDTGAINTAASTGDMATPYFIPVQPNTKVTFTIFETTSTYAPWFGMCEYSEADETTCITRQVNQDSGITSATFTVGANTHYIRVSARNMAAATEYQLEYGNKTTYAPYKTPMELCKIGTYQDYFYKSGNDWYKHEVIKKVTLPTSGYSRWTTHSEASMFYQNGVLSDALFQTGAITAVVENLPVKPQVKNMTEYYDTYAQVNKYGFVLKTDTPGIMVQNKNYSTLADFHTWISENPVEVRYVLANATNTQITDTELIEQLEALKSANSYRDTTHIDTTSDGNNLPVIIAATATGKADGTVTNAGNTYAKPKLTIYGTGTIGVYLNGSQMFQIELGSEGHITIDTEKMEAYKDSESNLKNRLVTGDYSKFRLEAGANQINFSGNINKCVVENYTRWL